MATSLSSVTNNTYNMYNIHGDCQAVQIGTSNTISESSNQTDNDDLTSDIEDLRFKLGRVTEEMADKFERKDEEIAALKNRVADLEAFKKKVEKLEVTTNTNTNTRRYKTNTSDDITLQLFGHIDVDTITISKKDSVDDLMKMIKWIGIDVMISGIGLYRSRGDSLTCIYNSFNNKNDYSLEQLGVVDQDQGWYW